MLSRRLLRTKVLRSLYSHFKSERTSLEASLTEYRRGVDKCYDLYLMLLQLPVDIVEYGNERLEIARGKMRPSAEDLTPNRRFVDNEAIAQLAGCEQLKELLKTKKLSWKDNEQVIKDLYTEITCSEIYKNYMSGVGSDKVFLVKIYSQLFEDNAALEQALEDMSMFWIDDTPYALSQAIKTVQNFSGSVFEEFKEYDDKEFGENLFLNSVRGSEEYFKVIDSLADNWDLERIAYIDRLIMVQAIAEVLSCPTIPVKVSLDEYIEIAKYYSTPASSTFINGVLNKAVEQFRSEQRIEKSGRGLLDTKS